MLGGVQEELIRGCLQERETEVRGGGRTCSRLMCRAAAWPCWGQSPGLPTFAQILLLRRSWGQIPYRRRLGHTSLTPAEVL